MQPIRSLESMEPFHMSQNDVPKKERIELPIPADQISPLLKAVDKLISEKKGEFLMLNDAVKESI